MHDVRIIVTSALIIGAVTALSAVRTLRPHERGVVFRLGRLRAGIRGPGPTLVVPVLDRLVRVDLTVATVSTTVRDVTTLDRVPVRVGAVICFRVVEPVKALLNIGDRRRAVSKLAGVLLCQAVGGARLDDLLSRPESVGAGLAAAINAVTEQPWGIRADRADLAEVVLPDYVKRAMAWQTDHERRGPVVTAEEQPAPAAATTAGGNRRRPPLDGSRRDRGSIRHPNVRSRWDC
jgi:regulator of protease activity HflC (stomatin/prohibitin superfamily)